MAATVSTLRFGGLMAVRTGVCALLLMGCGPRYALDEVPIEGGTAEQQAVVAAELLRFEQWSGAGRVSLVGVELTDGTASWEAEQEGRYNRITTKIQVSGDLQPESMALTLRHELCHALDVQENLLKGDVAAFDAVVDRVEREADHPLHEHRVGSRSRRRAEVFAYLCQLGPLATAMLSRPCSDIGDDYEAVADEVHTDAWQGDPDVRRAPLWSLGPTVGPAVMPFEIFDLQAVGSTSQDGFRVYVQGAGMPVVRDLSTVDGQQIPSFSDATVDAAAEGAAAEAPYGAPDLAPVGPVANTYDAVSDGSVALRIVRGLEHQPLGFRTAPRVNAGEADPWQLVDGCPSEASSVFLANGQLYTTWAEGEAVWWAPVIAP